MATIAPKDLRKGDVILGWTGDEDVAVDVSDRPPWHWSVTRVETVSDSRTHPLHDGWVRVYMPNALIDMPEGAEVIVRRKP